MIDVPILIVGGGPIGLTASILLSQPLDVYTIGRDLHDPDGAWCPTYGVADGGAVLVRPDGCVAWRSPSIDADPVRTLRTAVTAMLG